MEIDADTNRALLAQGYNRIMLMRNALQAAGLCRAFDDPDDDGREQALAVLEALHRQGVIVWIEPQIEQDQPHDLPPTLGERIAGGAISFSSRVASAASKRSPWSQMRARKTPRSQT